VERYQDLCRTGLKGLSGTGRAARAGARASAFADDALGGLGAPGKLGSIGRRLRYDLTETVVIGEKSTTNFARAGLAGEIGGYMQGKGLLSPVMQTRMSQVAAYVADITGNVLDANILQGTFQSSIDLEKQRLALQAEEQPERGAGGTVSVRNAGDSSSAQVPRLPSLGTVRHQLPPATHSVRFWW
jgi:hypothetical protein